MQIVPELRDVDDPEDADKDRQFAILDLEAIDHPVQRPVRGGVEAGPAVKVAGLGTNDDGALRQRLVHHRVGEVDDQLIR